MGDNPSEELAKYYDQIPCPVSSAPFWFSDLAHHQFLLVGSFRQQSGAESHVARKAYRSDLRESQFQHVYPTFDLGNLHAIFDGDPKERTNVIIFADIITGSSELLIDPHPARKSSQTTITLFARELRLDADPRSIFKAVEDNYQCKITLFYWKLYNKTRTDDQNSQSTSPPGVAFLEFTVDSKPSPSKSETGLGDDRARQYVRQVARGSAFKAFVSLEHRIALLIQFIRPKIALDITHFLPSLSQYASQGKTSTENETGTADISSLKKLLLQRIKRRGSSSSEEIAALDIPPVSFEVYAKLLEINYPDPSTPSQTTCQEPETPEEFDRSLDMRIEMRLNLQKLLNMLQFSTSSCSTIDLDNTLVVGAMRQVRTFFLRILAFLSTPTEHDQHSHRISSTEDSRVPIELFIYLSLGA
jgi:hypothetical protein